MRSGVKPWCFGTKKQQKAKQKREQKTRSETIDKSTAVDYNQERT